MSFFLLSVLRVNRNCLTWHLKVIHKHFLSKQSPSNVCVLLSGVCCLYFPFESFSYFVLLIAEKIFFFFHFDLLLLFVVVQSLSCVCLFATPRTAAHQASLSFIISLSLLKLMSTEVVMPSNHFILCCLLLFLLSIFPSIRVFSNEC